MNWSNAHMGMTNVGLRKVWKDETYSKILESGQVSKELQFQSLEAGSALGEGQLKFSGRALKVLMQHTLLQGSTKQIADKLSKFLVS